MLYCIYLFILFIYSVHQPAMV